MGIGEIGFIKLAEGLVSLVYIKMAGMPHVIDTRKSFIPPNASRVFWHGKGRQHNAGLLGEEGGGTYKFLYMVMDETARNGYKSEAWGKEWGCPGLERQIGHEIGELASLVSKGEQARFREKVERLLGQAQDMAFMQGYKYAIEVLEEGIVKK